MNILKITIQSAVKRPLIIILPAVIMLMFSVLNSYNPVLTVILGISSATGGTVFDGVISVLQLIMDPAIIPGIALFIAGAIILISLLAGIILSGYFHIVRITLEGINKTKGDFKAGIKKYFTKVFIITLKASLFTVFISGIMIIATVPSIIITRVATSTKPELLLAAIFVDILTAGVLFFGLIFSKIYLLYWYPAVFNNIPKPFKYVKRIVDGNFWQIVFKLVMFDIVFSVFLYLVLIIASITLKLIFGWIFITIFFTVLVVFIFYSFSEIVLSDAQNNRS